jgi:hypothetical protein
MSGALQAVYQNLRGFGLKIGDPYGGGFFAGQISTAGNGIADYNLVISPFSTGQSVQQYKNANTATTGADSDVDGTQNTADMVAGGSSTVYPAAHFCNDLVIGGFSDWYMPAKNEFEILYYNLKPTTTSNDTGSGINANAVPARASNYTAGTPAQTSSLVFQTGGAEAMEVDPYISSTEESATNVKRQNTSSGAQSSQAKASLAQCRAIRRVAV